MIAELTRVVLTADFRQPLTFASRIFSGTTFGTSLVRVAIGGEVGQIASTAEDSANSRFWFVL